MQFCMRNLRKKHPRRSVEISESSESMATYIHQGKQASNLWSRRPLRFQQEKPQHMCPKIASDYLFSQFFMGLLFTHVPAKWTMDRWCGTTAKRRFPRDCHWFSIRQLHLDKSSFSGTSGMKNWERKEPRSAFGLNFGRIYSIVVFWTIAKSFPKRVERMR